MLIFSVTELSDVHVSDSFTRHIELLEGFRAKAYRDINGVVTIGYGHVIRSTEQYLQTAVLTREEALVILRADVKEAEAAVNRLVHVPLKQEQFDALVSFTFNVGQGALANSTLLRKLNAGHCCAVPDQMRRWTNNGKAGMIARRAAEVALWIGDA